MRTLFVVGVALALSPFTGCSHKEQAESPATQTIAPTPQTPAAPVSVAPPPSVAVSVATDASGAGTEPSVAELNRALQVWLFQHSGPPKDLNELVTAGYLKRLPSPPAGKRFVFDSKLMAVRAVEK
ncbi:MAG: hypothetical protein HY300_11425 [Verrucomicrobia bacterium]|nr:hypothetical protein [Verrucomicrobiota bacterium]